MLDLSTIHFILAKIIPLSFMKVNFIQNALLGLVLLAPITAIMGIHVINFRMPFFADTISHATFTGLALGILFSLNLTWAVNIFGILIAILILTVKKYSSLSTDTTIGVFFSITLAIGIAIISKEPAISYNLPQILYGDILTISGKEIFQLLLLLVVTIIFQIFFYNDLFFIALNKPLAKAYNIKTSMCEYFYTILLALVITSSIWAVGILLITALLIVPAATSRNLVLSARKTFWLTIILSLFSSISGLVISFQKNINTSTGAIIIIVSCLIFFLSLIYSNLTLNKKHLFKTC